MMKKLYFAIALLIGLNVSMAQTKSTGVVGLPGGLMTLKIDKNLSTSTVTLTLTGPDNKWFGIGLNATRMSSGTDCLYFATSFVDATINGQGNPTTDSDTTNNWTISSDTTSGSTRTLVLTRGFVGGTGDYSFVYNDNTLNVIWAYGNDTSFAYHQSRGSSSLGFTLGVEDFTSLEKINIAPNPSNGIVTLTKNNQTTISKVTVFDINGKVVKVVDSELSLDAIQINLSDFSKGVYFLEISNEMDKVVRKIVIE